MTSSSLTPYPCQQQENNGNYRFVTTAGAHYEVYFTDASGYFEGFPHAAATVMVGLALLSGVASGTDPRIADTLTALMLQRLEADPAQVLAYFCDTTDGRAASRYRKFAAWWDRHPGVHQSLVKQDIQAAPTLYAALIYRADHPFRQEISQGIAQLESKL